MTTANTRQVGGSHYKTEGLQHWDIMHPAYLLGCASKYVSRHRQKGGREDLEKAIHYCEKFSEIQGSTPLDWFVRLSRLLEWMASAKLDHFEASILYNMLHQQDMKKTITLINLHIQRCYTEDSRAELLSDRSDGLPVIEPKRPGTPEDGGHHARQPAD